MSLEGKTATKQTLQGNASASDVIQGRVNYMKTIHGYSAYEVAVLNGFKGTEQEWLDSLIGPQGIPGTAAAKGDKGDPGKDGYTPIKGVDYYTEAEKEEVVAEVVSTMLPVRAINFTDFEIGSFTETVNGEVVNHSVTFDTNGRPTAIDGVTITWGDV